MTNWVYPIWVGIGLCLVSSVAWSGSGTVGHCSLPIVVRATLLAEGTPEWSTAMIYHRDTGSSKSYSINSGSNQLAPGVKVIEIHKLVVIVDNGGKLERCAGEAHQFTGTTSQVGKGDTFRDEPTQITAEKLPARLREIFEALADAQKAGVAGIGGAARPGVKAAWTDKFSVPGISGGPQGQRAFQVGRLQKDSIYYQLGIRNFDVVKTINGLGFASPEVAEELLGKLGDVAALTIEVQRRGKPVKIDINLK